MYGERESRIGQRAVDVVGVIHTLNVDAVAAQRLEEMDFAGAGAKSMRGPATRPESTT
jgi:hypothetical protein